MADPSLFDSLRIPIQALAALDWRPYHFAVQPVHYLIRTVHVLATGAFFGGVALLDVRLMGWRQAVPLRLFALHVLPWLWASFAAAAATGLALFLYDPVHAGAHAYWTPKLIAIGFGLVNAAAFHRTGYVAALSARGVLPLSARMAGLVSLVCWTAAMVFACLDSEGPPKVLLRLSIIGSNAVAVRQRGPPKHPPLTLPQPSHATLPPCPSPAISRISMTDLFGLLEQKLDWLDARQRVVAQNISNADTPNYQPKDVSPFAAMLGQFDVTPTLTSPLHLAGLVQGATTHPHTVSERAPDGNGVGLEDQLTKVADNENAQALTGNLWKSYMGMFMTALGHG